MHLVSLFQWLNALPFSVWLRESEWTFPMVQTIHILGLGLSVGTMLWVDLRLLGLVTKRHRASEIVGQLEPVALAGFGVMFVSGLLLFIAEPMKCYTTLAFQLKAIMLVLAGFNMWYFHTRIYPSVAGWDQSPVIPWRARAVGFSSMALWFGIIIAGRWTARV